VSTHHAALCAAGGACKSGVQQHPGGASTVEGTDCVSARFRQLIKVGQKGIHYTYTVYDRIFGGFPSKRTVYHRIYRVLANPTYDIPFVYDHFRN